jgi:hypothetical protein
LHPRRGEDPEFEIVASKNRLLGSAPFLNGTKSNRLTSNFGQQSVVILLVIPRLPDGCPVGTLGATDA